MAKLLPQVVFSFFSKPRIHTFPFRVDMHSHLLPGLDDGVKSLEESRDVILALADLGYQKLITTPHIMSDAYRNTPEGIQESLEKLRTFLRASSIDMEISAAAEYYLDENLPQALTSDQPLLTFGNRYLLFETNYLTEPYILKEFIFQATNAGYKLVLAHPERYQYMNLEKAEDLINRGVYLQLNLLSLSGHYSKQIQRMAEQFIEKKWVHFLGTDCHSLFHVQQLREVLKSRGFKKVLDLPLLNTTL